MKRIFVTLFAVVLAAGFTFASQDAEARRLGGGRSSGMSRDSGVMKREAAPAPRPAPTAPASAPSGASRWLGPLAGLAAGIGLAALFSHLGMGAGFANFAMMLLIAMAVFFLVRMLLRRKAPQEQPMQYAGATDSYAPPQAGSYGSSAAAPALAAANIPADFDVEGFLRQAKLNFVRLQAANDAGNMEDIRAFTTPEMFAEIKLEYQDRGKAAQQTDVVQLDAALLDVTTEATRHVASVRFSGSIRESVNAAPEAFDEVWHLAKPTDGSTGWVIAGIQQFN